ncbi:MAG: hypothetical protein JHC87_09810, partial [Thermoleophilaceae bacterium]|nr:hypothetical protein [Thermoleophilaceae bacterium]
MTQNNADAHGSNTPPPVHGFLAKLADFTFRRRRLTVLLWIISLLVLAGLNTAFGGQFKVDYSTPGSDSKAAAKLIEQRFPGTTGDSLTVVWHSPGGA